MLPTTIMDKISRSSSAQTLSKSPSLQTHLTCATSSQRLRGSASIGTQLSHSTESQLGSKHAQPPNDLSLQDSNNIRTVPTCFKNTWIFRVGCLYALGSGLFLAWHVFLSLFTFGGDTTKPSAFAESPLESWPAHQRMSTLSTVRPRPKFEPFVIKSRENPVGITLCLWVEEHEIPNMQESASRWVGPISLVVKTTRAPSSIEYKALLRGLASSDLAYWQRLSLHILSTDTTPSNHSPNAYLNLARLFSTSSTVLMFPGNSSALYNFTSFAKHLDLHSFKTIIPSVITPTVLTHSDNNVYPFQPLAPVLLSREHSVWCTERAFMSPTRESDWDQCMWQLWMESHGEMDKISVDQWDPFISPETSLVAAKLRRRFGTKFRSESCILAANRIGAMGMQDKELRRKKAWLKNFCEETAM